MSTSIIPLFLFSRLYHSSADISSGHLSRRCRSTSCAKYPPFSISESYVPSSMTAPLSMTRMRSQFLMVDRRCATTILVHSRLSSASEIFFCVLLSSADVASSKIRNYHRGILRQNAGYLQTLPLTAGQIVSVIFIPAIVADMSFPSSRI